MTPRVATLGLLGAWVLAVPAQASTGALSLGTVTAVRATAASATLFDELIEPPEGGASAPDEWSTPSFDPPRVEAPAFDVTRPDLDGRLRIEARAGLWLLDQASRLKITQPAAGAGLVGRPVDRLRLDANYLFTFARSGTRDLNVFNTVHALSGRAHFAWPAGAVWLTAGGGPVSYLVTSATSANERTIDAGLHLALGLGIALGAETVVSDRLIRFEVGAASRDRRIDGLATISVGF